jgi:uncharacterized protein with GYD domain
VINANPEEATMAIYISLINFTEQGIKNVKDSPARANAFRDMAKKNAVNVRDIFWCVGRYDMVVITEGSDEAITATLLDVGMRGNVRSQTLRAMDADTFQKVLEKVA